VCTGSYQFRLPDDHVLISQCFIERRYQFHFFRGEEHEVDTHNAREFKLLFVRDRAAVYNKMNSFSMFWFRMAWTFNSFVIDHHDKKSSPLFAVRNRH